MKKILVTLAAAAAVLPSAALADSFSLSIGEPAYPAYPAYPAPAYVQPGPVFYNGYYEEPHHFYNYHRHYGYWERRNPGMHHGWHH